MQYYKNSKHNFPVCLAEGAPCKIAGYGVKTNFV